MRIKENKGQSLIEIVFGVGVLVMVITAVASLIVKTTGIKAETAQRKKATEMGEVIVENLLNNKKNNPDSFWLLTNIPSGSTIPDYSGYTYGVNLTQNTANNCSSVEVECADAVITISWGNNQTFTTSRFFSKFF